MRSFKTIIKWLDKHKSWTGLNDYKILLNTDFIDSSDSLAELEIDILEKVVKVVLTTDFKKLSRYAQNKVLMHELIHARVSRFNKEVENFKDDLEEELVNDLERGFSYTGELK